MRILANHIRYILIMEAGASDHLTKIAENEIAIIEMVSGRPIDFERSFCSISSPYDTCRHLMKFNNISASAKYNMEGDGGARTLFLAKIAT